MREVGQHRLVYHRFAGAKAGKHQNRVKPAGGFECCRDAKFSSAREFP